MSDLRRIRLEKKCCTDTIIQYHDLVISKEATTKQIKKIIKKVHKNLKDENDVELFIHYASKKGFIAKIWNLNIEPFNFDKCKG